MKFCHWPIGTTPLLCLTLCHLVLAVPNLRALELLSQLGAALRRARTIMRSIDRALPMFDTAYASDGACYRGFGTSIHYEDCSAALGLMPALYHPSEVKLSPASLLVDAIYEAYRPIIWKHVS